MQVLSALLNRIIHFSVIVARLLVLLIKSFLSLEKPHMRNFFGNQNTPFLHSHFDMLKLVVVASFFFA